MSVSFANVQTTNMELTPVRVTYGGVDLGGTLSNAVITAKYTKSDIKADQSGTTVRDRRVSGLEINVATEVVEIQSKDIWKVVFPHATLITSGAQKAIQFNAAVGDGDLANSNILTLHPLSQPDNVVDFDHTFFKATSLADSTITYGPTEQARLKIVWNALPDDSVTPERFYRYGDTTI